MNEQEKRDVERDVYVSLRDHFAALRSEDLRRLDERFEAQEKALDRAFAESQRRLDVLNHAHEQARQKEVDFIGREVFENHVATNTKDHADQRRNVEERASVLSDRVDAAAKALQVALSEQQNQASDRLSRLENFQSKLLGLALAAPFLTGLAVYFLTQR
jgi:hypothetical protein